MFKVYNPKQKIALDKIKDNDHMYYLHYGGSRSGKTALDIRVTVLRAIKYPKTRHLVCRASKIACIESVWMITLLPMLQEDFPGVWYEDKQKKIINFTNGSSIWAGGFENTQHTDNLLSREWATIIIVEATELKYHLFSQLRTRLNWDPALSDIQLKMITECNPPKKSNWIFKWFFSKVDYITRKPLDEKISKRVSKLHFHPLDNKANLSPVYLEQLSTLQGSDKARFWDGDFWDDTSGQIYDFDRVVNVVDDKIRHDHRLELWRAWDFGIEPSATFIIFIQLRKVPPSEEFPLGFVIEIFDEIMEKNKKAEYYANTIKAKSYHHDLFSDAGDPAGATRNESLESWVTVLRKFGIRMQMPRGFRGIDDYVSHSNNFIHAVRVNEQQCPNTVAFFENWARPKDKDGRVIEGSKPEHNEYSHGGTAFYYWTGKRFPIRASFFEQQ